jgi:aldose sugar dehydrogenase
MRSAFSLAGLTFVTSDRFAPWKGNLLVAAMSGRRMERIALNQGPLQQERRESLLAPLGLRLRDVQQGPDGYLYVAAERTSTARPDGLLLRIEPAQ